jgi:hypothetical protein
LPAIGSPWIYIPAAPGTHFLGILVDKQRETNYYKGDAGNSLLPYQQILVKAIFLALIGPKWSILVECINWH